MNIQVDNNEVKNDSLFLLMQMARYLITGGLSFLADFFIFNLFLHRVHYQIAHYSGLIVGLIVNYSLSKTWVFGNREAIYRREIVTFVLFTIGGFAFSGFAMFLGMEIMKMDGRVTKFVVAVLVFVINFMARKYVIFRNG